MLTLDQARNLKLDIQAELETLASTFQAASNAFDALQGTLVKVAITAHSAGDIRPVVRLLEYVRLHTPKGVDAQALADWVLAYIPCRYNKTAQVWKFDNKKQRAVDQSLIDDLNANKWYSKAKTADKAFKAIVPHEALLRVYKRWNSKLEEHGDFSGVTAEQINALGALIRDFGGEL